MKKEEKKNGKERIEKKKEKNKIGTLKDKEANNDDFSDTFIGFQLKRPNSLKYHVLTRHDGNVVARTWLNGNFHSH